MRKPDLKNKEPIVREPSRELPVKGSFDVVVSGGGIAGAAAGTASALAVRQSGGNVHALPVAGLQCRLKEQGFLLDPALLAPLPDES